MEKIKINEWGRQVTAYLTTWSEIRKRGFLPRDRSFGSLNDGRSCLYFCNRYLFDKRYPKGANPGTKPNLLLYITVEDIKDIYAAEGDDPCRHCSWCVKGKCEDHRPCKYKHHA